MHAEFSSSQHSYIATIPEYTLYISNRIGALFLLFVGGSDKIVDDVNN